MAIKSRATLKTTFSTGARPGGSDYSDFVDSFLHLTDTTAQSVAGTLAVPTMNVGTVTVTAGINLSAGVGVATDVSAGNVKLSASCAGYFKLTLNGVVVYVPYWASA